MATPARYRNPAHVGTYVISATHNWSGPAAVKCRSMRSGAVRALSSRPVVRNAFRRLPPCRPAPRMSRATRLRPTGIWSCPGFVDTPEWGRKGASTMPKSHRPYPPEFRARLVELVRKGRTPEELGRQFEPSAQAIRNWVKQAALDARQRTDGLTTAEREQVRRLRREVRQVREEREILKNAAAWFARETTS